MSSILDLPPADYEPRDAQPKRLLAVAAGLAGGIVLALTIALLLYITHDPDAMAANAVMRQTSFRESVHAQTDIAADWASQDTAVREHLHTYGWVDRNAGVVRIPVDRAMDLLLDEAAKPKGGTK